MKCTKSLALLAVALCLVVAVSGCKKKPQNVTSLPQRGAPTGGGPEQPAEPRLPTTRTDGGIPVDRGIPPVAATNIEPGTVQPTGKDFSTWDRDTEMLKAESIYFDFDMSNIRPNQTAKLDVVFTKMQAMPGKALRIEGNCDERGTEEYNRALGERRALAAREYLVRKGMDASMIDTISYGKDKPLELGHTEASWSKNRRDDFVVLSPPAK